MTYILFALVVIIQPVAQILEKHGINQLGQLTLSLTTLTRIVTNSFVVGGVALSATGLLLWLVVLSRGSVSHFYPLGAVSYIILAGLAWWLLKEPVGPLQWAGIGLIVTGAVLLNAK